MKSREKKEDGHKIGGNGEVVERPKTLNKIILIENSYHPKNSEFIAKLVQTRAVQIELRTIDSEQVEAAIKEFDPELILIDVDSMRHRDALDLAHQIRSWEPETAIIFLSERINPVYVKEGMIAAIWSRAYWLNQPSRKPEMVIPEILRAFKGQKQLNPEVLESAHREASHIGLLSPQQHRVMQAMSRGASNAKIAEDCHLTQKAVERTIYAASKLLGVPTGSADVNPRVMASNLYRSSMLFHDPRDSV